MNPAEDLPQMFQMLQIVVPILAKNDFVINVGPCIALALMKNMIDCPLKGRRSTTQVEWHNCKFIDAKGCSKTFPCSLEPWGSANALWQGRGSKQKWLKQSGSPVHVSLRTSKGPLTLHPHSSSKGKTLGNFVVGKEEVGKLFVPVLLGPVHELLQRGLECPVETFNQAISLQVIGRGPNKL